MTQCITVDLFFTLSLCVYWHKTKAHVTVTVCYLRQTPGVRGWPFYLQCSKSKLGNFCTGAPEQDIYFLRNLSNILNVITHELQLQNGLLCKIFKTELCRIQSMSSVLSDVSNNMMVLPSSCLFEQPVFVTWIMSWTVFQGGCWWVWEEMEQILKTK